MAESDANPPQPDPTTRATEIVDKGLKALKDEMLVRLQSEHDLCTEKFERINQRFDDVNARTAEQKSDTKAALTDALTAAGNAITLQTTASEKAIDKSEQATAKELAQMAARFGTAIAALADKLDSQRDQERKDIDEVKAFIAIAGQEINTIRSVKAGGLEARDGLYAFVGFLTGLIVIGGLVAAMWPK